ncbi:MAG: EutN/CcmL family microcompartment protein [Oscillospiraceae bacterium]|jgi:ethanolamine utilization protein EutN|nr:EutN/CcmL family microcompartment protein [Oscillospiraceae bacterium]
MVICQVIGHVWATKKEPALSGLKLMVVRELGAPEFDCEEYISSRDGIFVAADVVGAGIGERVLVVSGSTARLAVSDNEPPVDCAIVGIIDSLDMDKKLRRMDYSLRQSLPASTLDSDESEEKGSAT